MGEAIPRGTLRRRLRVWIGAFFVFAVVGSLPALLISALAHSAFVAAWVGVVLGGW
jgi:hypothetical protein